MIIYKVIVIVLLFGYFTKYIIVIPIALQVNYVFISHCVREESPGTALHCESIQSLDDTFRNLELTGNQPVDRQTSSC